MRAATCRRYGPPESMTVETFKRPQPKANEVLVKVHTSSVTSGDVRLRAFTGAGIYWVPIRLMFGLLRPRNPVPGMEFSGQIEAVGKHVTRFQAGDPVFGMRIGGANAEYVTIPESGAIVIKPESLSFEDAAATPFGALSALEFLRDIGRIKPRERVLIYGASGAVGVFAVQLARQFGAEVTGVCSTANVSLVKSLNADVVIDYTTTNFVKGAARYDLILDTVGGTSFSKCQNALSPDGRHVFLVQDGPALLHALWTHLRPGKRSVTGFSGGQSKDDLRYISGLMDNGSIRAVIDRSFDLSEIAAAHRYVQTGRKRGAVTIRVEAARACANHQAAADIQKVPQTSDRLTAPSAPDDRL